MDFATSRILAQQASAEAKIAAANASIISRGGSPIRNRFPIGDPSRIIAGTNYHSNWMIQDRNNYYPSNSSYTISTSFSPPPPQLVSPRSPLRFSEIKARINTTTNNRSSSTPTPTISIPSTANYSYNTQRIGRGHLTRRAFDHQPKRLTLQQRNRLPADTPSLVVYNPNLVLSPRSRVVHPNFPISRSAYTSPERLSILGAQTRMRASHRAQRLRQMWN